MRSCTFSKSAFGSKTKNGAFDILYSIFCPIDMFTLCAFWIWHRKCMSLPMPFDIALHGLVFKTRSHLWSFLKGSEESLRNGIISKAWRFVLLIFTISIITLNRTIKFFIGLIGRGITVVDICPYPPPPSVLMIVIACVVRQKSSLKTVSTQCCNTMIHCSIFLINKYSSKNEPSWISLSGYQYIIQYQDTRTMYSCRLKTPKVRVGAGAFIVMMNNSFNLLYINFL